MWVATEKMDRQTSMIQGIMYCNRKSESNIYHYGNLGGKMIVHIVCPGEGVIAKGTKGNQRRFDKTEDYVMTFE